MSEDRIPSSFYLHQPQRKKQGKYKKDPDRPKCVNKGCDCEVHLVRYTDSGKPIYRPVCMYCHYANIGYKNYKYKQGVTPIKKDYCENYLDERLRLEQNDLEESNRRCRLTHNASASWSMNLAPRKTTRGRQKFKSLS